MPKIIPIKELKNTAEISEMCHRIDEPIYITKNGYGDMVVMSIETYEKQMAMADVYNKISVAERQIKNDELLDGEEIINKLSEKYG